MRKYLFSITFILILIDVSELYAQMLTSKQRTIAYKLKTKNTYDVADVYYFNHSLVLFPDSTYILKYLAFETKEEKKLKKRKAQFHKGRWKFIRDSSLIVLNEKNKSVFVYFVIKDQLAFQLLPEYLYMYKDVSHLISWKKFRPGKRYIARLRRKLRERENEN